MPMLKISLAVVGRTSGMSSSVCVTGLNSGAAYRTFLIVMVVYPCTPRIRAMPKSVIWASPWSDMRILSCEKHSGKYLGYGGQHIPLWHHRALPHFGASIVSHMLFLWPSEIQLRKINPSVTSIKKLISTFPRFSSGCLPIYAKKLLRWTHRDTSPGGKLGFKWAIPSSSEMLGWLRVRQVAISRLSRCFLSSQHPFEWAWSCTRHTCSVFFFSAGVHLSSLMTTYSYPMSHFWMWEKDPGQVLTFKVWSVPSVLSSQR
jgi:hypothetical protein